MSLIGLIGDKSSLRINLSTLQGSILHVVLGPSNEPRMRLMEMGVERIKLDISLIHEIKGVWLHRDFLKYLGIVNRGLCMADQCRNGIVQIHQSMHLEPTLDIMKSCLRIERKVHFNGAVVKGTHHISKVNSQLFVGIKVDCPLCQDIVKVLIDNPIAFIVGVQFVEFVKSLFPLIFVVWERISTQNFVRALNPTG